MAKAEEQEAGTYVKSGAIKVLDSGDVEATITLVGSQKSLERLIGHALVLENGDKKLLGKMVAFGIRVGKNDKRVCTAKVKGARDLDALAGRYVTLTRSQRDLPGISEEA